MFPPVICRSADFCFERDWLLSIIFPVGDTLDVAGSIDLTTANWKSMYDVFWKMHVVVWAPPPFLLCPYKALSKPYANMWHICIFTAVLFNSCSLRDEAVFATKQQQFGEHRRIQNAECGTTAPSLYFRSVWYFLKKPEEPQVRLPAFKVHIWLGCDSFGKMATKVDRNHSRRNFVEYPPNDIFFIVLRPMSISRTLFQKLSYGRRCQQKEAQLSAAQCINMVRETSVVCRVFATFTRGQRAALTCSRGIK